MELQRMNGNRALKTEAIYPTHPATFPSTMKGRKRGREENMRFLL